MKKMNRYCNFLNAKRVKSSFSYNSPVRDFRSPIAHSCLSLRHDYNRICTGRFIEIPVRVTRHEVGGVCVCVGELRKYENDSSGCQLDFRREASPCLARLRPDIACLKAFTTLSW